MNIDEVIERFRWEVRNLQWPGETLEQLPNVTRRSRPESFGLTSFAVTEENADELVHEEILRAKDLKGEVEWKVFSFDSPGLVDRLKKTGFSVGEREAVVIYDLADGLRPFEESDGHEVDRVATLEVLAEYRAVCEAVFDKDYSYTTGQLADAIQSGRRGHDAYLSYVAGVPASVGRLYTNPSSAFAGLYGGGTLPIFRGQGLYRAVVAARARDAVEAGARYLQVDALPASLPILLRMGFVRVADTWPCTLGV